MIKNCQSIKSLNFKNNFKLRAFIPNKLNKNLYPKARKCNSYKRSRSVHIFTLVWFSSGCLYVFSAKITLFFFLEIFVLYGMISIPPICPSTFPSSFTRTFFARRTLDFDLNKKMHFQLQKMYYYLGNDSLCKKSLCWKPYR
jgi:hypothetical protein